MFKFTLDLKKRFFNVKIVILFSMFFFTFVHNGAPYITSLFLKQKPTPESVVACMKVEDEYVLKPKEERVFYFLKQYVLSVAEEDLATILQFVTGSSVMPEYIQVTFNAVSGIMRHQTAHTCSNIFEMPNYYSSFQELKRELKNVLHHSSLTE